jgi:hypothetical protein
MNVAREAETKALLMESERIRSQLTNAARELDGYVQALQDYLERRDEERSGDA